MTKIKINKIIQYLVASDFLLFAGAGLISPIFAIFVTEQMQNGSATVVGIATAVYWIVKSLVQLPIAYLIDHKKGEKDDYIILIIGLILIGFVSFSFLFVREPWHLYLNQLFYAIGFAFVIPSWSAIFIHHIDKGHEGFEWSLDSTSLGIASGITGFIGGFMADKFGFQPVFVVVGIISFASIIFPMISAQTTFETKKQPKKTEYA